MTKEERAELEKYYEKVMETLNSEGWKLIQADLEGQLEQMEKAGWSSPDDKLSRHAGMVVHCRQMVKLPEIYENGYNEVFKKDE